MLNNDTKYQSNYLKLLLLPLRSKLEIFLGRPNALLLTVKSVLKFRLLIAPPFTVFKDTVSLFTGALLDFELLFLLFRLFRSFVPLLLFALLILLSSSSSFSSSCSIAFAMFRRLKRKASCRMSRRNKRRLSMLPLMVESRSNNFR